MSNNKLNTKLLSVSGRARSGKNQTAIFIKEILAEHHVNDKSYSSYEEKAFAALLKKFASELTGVPIDGFETTEDKAKDLGPEWSTYDQHGLKIQMTRRLFLKRFGTDACNMNLHRDTWINGLFKDWHKDTKWIVTDVRFPQEVQSIRNRNGVIIRVRRPSTEDRAETHPSEIALDGYNGFDFTIINDGTLDELKEKVRNVLFQLKLI